MGWTSWMTPPLEQASVTCTATTFGAAHEGSGRMCVCSEVESHVCAQEDAECHACHGEVSFGSEWKWTAWRPAKGLPLVCSIRTFTSGPNEEGGRVCVCKNNQVLNTSGLAAIGRSVQGAVVSRQHHVRFLVAVAGPVAAATLLMAALAGVCAMRQRR